MAAGQAREGFDLDLLDGEMREGWLARILALHSGRYLELKTDHKCWDTGNLFVEFSQKGRPSGLATTTADWWAFEYSDGSEFLDSRWLIVPRHVLRAKAAASYQAGHRVRGGDNNNYEGVLLPIRSLLTR